MIAIIPARGGSKGLAGKNIRTLCGKPMIAYVIEEGLKSQYIDEIFVSTDDRQIAGIAIQYGAKCPFLRPAELATDHSHPIDAFIYTIERLNEEFGYQIDNFVVMQPTSPLVSVEDIDGAITQFNEMDADSVISYTKEWHRQHKYITSDYRFEPILDDNIFLDKHNSRNTYFCNGAVMVIRYALIKERKYYTDHSFAYIMPRSRSVDIDTIEDFEYAEYLLNDIQKETQST